MNATVPNFIEPAIVRLCRSDPDVIKDFGGNPVRVFPGRAPQGAALPYARFNLASGIPEHYLGNRPDIDSLTYQIDVFATTLELCQRASQSIIAAIECESTLFFRDYDIDPVTGNWRFTLHADFWECRH